MKQLNVTDSKANRINRIKNNGKWIKLKKSFQLTVGCIKKYHMLYLMTLPGLLYFLIFHYLPIYGIVIAFQDYSIFKGFSNAKWVGFDNFIFMFKLPGFKQALTNNMIISISKLVCGFPVPIILALMLNEVKHVFYKRFVQTSLILPNFMSWVVVSGLLYALLSPRTGVMGTILHALGYTGEIVNLMGSKEHFRQLLVVSHVWYNAGVGVVLYVAAIATIDSQMYEAAKIDGAGKWRQLWNITLPSLRTTIVILLIFRVGQLMNADFEQVFSLYNPLVEGVSEILDTYVFKVGLFEAKFSLATAAGLFKSAIGLTLVMFTNYAAKKIDKESGLI